MSINITSLPVANTIDPVQDTFPIVTNSINTTQQINRNTFLGLSSNPVSINDTQTLTNKTITAPNISAPVLSGTVTGTYTLGGTPTFPASVATLTGSQTLTNKVLTSPTINSPTITNATLTADTISGYSAGTTGTIYGIGVTSGVITGAGTVGSAALVTNAVQGNQLATSAITLGYAQITTPIISTNSTTAVQISGLTVTVTIPAGGRKIKITAFARNIYNTSTGNGVSISIWDGTVGSGTQLSAAKADAPSQAIPAIAIAVVTPAAGSKTYNVGIQTGNASFSANLEAGATFPAFILVEAI